MNRRILALLIDRTDGGHRRDRRMRAEAAIKEDFKPSTFNQPGQAYPQVNSQGYARFRIVAPEARSVVGQPGPGRQWRHHAEPGRDDGAWVGTTGPLDEGFHYYHLTVDGGSLQRSRHPELLRLRRAGKAASRSRRMTATSMR